MRSLNRERITNVQLGDYVESNVTVLFLDMRDYTPLAETMTPEENFKFVNAFHGRMGPVIQQHQGFVNQYLGDAIMAIFPGHPSDALRAAIEMQCTLRHYNQERANKGRRPVNMGIGIHTGPLIMGIIGDRKRMDAATIADTVNTASRIERLTKHYGVSILLSQESREELDKTDEFAFRYLGKILLKGKNEPHGLYECIQGDPPDLEAHKADTLPDFEAGLQQFLSRDFPNAAATFHKVLRAHPDDQAARLFLNKASRYTIDGVPEDWTGVEIMTSK